MGLTLIRRDSGRLAEAEKKGKVQASHLTSYRPLALPLPPVLTGGPHEHPLRGGVQKHSHIFISEPACIDPLSDDNKIT